ncbi:hypothetical protein ASD24_24255 [Paenibacillus sp. Root52]|uniref:hypothetical protein n=1 Tax=Paenibacillus sp. Root52 TaxID=1736552 RepID=UPI0006F1E371|nr:hypothetical protein [Paenibacillus sp. Root52]KQY90914.1 hypothetical protein ASD24_24255 [Paenibacillus sp. Root52]
MKIERLREDCLEKEEWDFGVKTEILTDKIIVFLRGYTKSKRQSKRHKFKEVEVYDSSRKNDKAPGKIPSSDQVPKPQDVLLEMEKRITTSITFKL